MEEASTSQLPESPAQRAERMRQRLSAITRALGNEEVLIMSAELSGLTPEEVSSTFASMIELTRQNIDRYENG